MNQPALTCQREERRQIVRDSELYGLDYAEDLSDLYHEPAFCIHFLGKAPDDFYENDETKRELLIGNLVIQGGRRIRDLQVITLKVRRAKEAGLDDCLLVTLNKRGDLSAYTLCLVELDDQQRPIIESNLNGRVRYRPLKGFDRRYACVDFNFKSSCPNNLDCHTETSCSPVKRDEP